MLEYFREQYAHNLQLKIDKLRPKYKAKISDGYHTCVELYGHRNTLYIALCKAIRKSNEIWKSKQHSDGTRSDGFFILGIKTEQNEQITYHLPLSYWQECEFATTLATAPTYDGHSSNDVLERLKKLV
jgi:hypothetical protein